MSFSHLALIVERAGVTASEASGDDPEYLMLTYGPMGSPILSVPLKRLPKLKREKRLAQQELGLDSPCLPS